MKQYKYKINGNLYNVTVNDIEENIARVEVNGTHIQLRWTNWLRLLPNLLPRPASALKQATGSTCCCPSDCHFK